MLIRFCLAWLKPGTPASKAFKLQPAALLFQEYLDRISKFGPCQSWGLNQKEMTQSGLHQWVCDRKGNELSSESLAKNLQNIMDQGTRQLNILIGGPDGFSKSEMDILKPDLKWSFGPLTLPHELAAVISAEQIYRAWSIIRKMPYHLSH